MSKSASFLIFTLFLFGLCLSQVDTSVSGDKRSGPDTPDSTSSASKSSNSSLISSLRSFTQDRPSNKLYAIIVDDLSKNCLSRDSHLSSRCLKVRRAFKFFSSQRESIVKIRPLQTDTEGELVASTETVDAQIVVGRFDSQKTLSGEVSFFRISQPPCLLLIYENLIWRLDEQLDNLDEIYSEEHPPKGPAFEHNLKLLFSLLLEGEMEPSLAYPEGAPGILEQGFMLWGRLQAIFPGHSLEVWGLLGFLVLGGLLALLLALCMLCCDSDSKQEEILQEYKTELDEIERLRSSQKKETQSSSRLGLSKRTKVGGNKYSKGRNSEKARLRNPERSEGILGDSDSDDGIEMDNILGGLIKFEPKESSTQENQSNSKKREKAE